MVYGTIFLILGFLMDGLGMVLIKFFVVSLPPLFIWFAIKYRKNIFKIKLKSRFSSATHPFLPHILLRFILVSLICLYLYRSYIPDDLIGYIRREYEYHVNQTGGKYIKTKENELIINLFPDEDGMRQYGLVFTKIIPWEYFKDEIANYQNIENYLFTKMFIKISNNDSKNFEIIDKEDPYKTERSKMIRYARKLTLPLYRFSLAIPPPKIELLYYEDAKIDNVRNNYFIVNAYHAVVFF
jgi:hypothetical protein